jgi:hypothetical protein
MYLALLYTKAVMKVIVYFENLIFIWPCIIVIVENKRPTWCHLLFLFHLLCDRHVSDINISIIGSLRLFCWITTLVMCSSFDVCWCFGVVRLAWYPCCRLKPRTSIQKSVALFVLWSTQLLCCRYSYSAGTYPESPTEYSCTY